MGWMFDNVVIARPRKPANHCEPFTPNDPTAHATLFDPVAFCWSRAKGAFPAVSNISLDRPGRTAVQARCHCRSLHESMAGERNGRGAASVTCSRR
jgi:hypothetical protein